MCKGFELDEPQKRALRACLADAKAPGRPWSERLRSGLTMFVIGLHSGRSRIPNHYDPNNRLF